MSNVFVLEILPSNREQEMGKFFVLEKHAQYAINALLHGEAVKVWDNAGHPAGFIGFNDIWRMRAQLAKPDTAPLHFLVQHPLPYKDDNNGHQSNQHSEGSLDPAQREADEIAKAYARNAA